MRVSIISGTDATRLCTARQLTPSRTRPLTARVVGSPTEAGLRAARPKSTEEMSASATSGSIAGTGWRAGATSARSCRESFPPATPTWCARNDSARTRGICRTRRAASARCSSRPAAVVSSVRATGRNRAVSTNRRLAANRSFWIRGSRRTRGDCSLAPDSGPCECVGVDLHYRWPTPSWQQYRAELNIREREREREREWV
jgi:hypothetical protein